MSSDKARFAARQRFLARKREKMGWNDLECEICGCWFGNARQWLWHDELCRRRIAALVGRTFSVALGGGIVTLTCQETSPAASVAPGLAPASAAG